ncbi:MAG TPA: CT583 family protein [Chlamydiales bacterium]|nr:MAG: hypothetical protein A3F67_03040 [Verrucomicrobia bacterium RIFCSPHIGHO2_12_FULL_41_10]HLB52419.1 CT583 family protein [Chlamydiales bacterium]
MAKFNDLLNLRFRQKESRETKMTALVERANNGDLSSFSGVFRVSPLNEQEKSAIATILDEHKHDEFQDTHTDLASLSILTSEVKAIANQAVILHGERIKKAQELLKRYRDGAFTAWLFATYGNRQTPYNFLQYYEFYMMMPATLQPTIDQMPRQAIYTLASRQGASEKKEAVVRDYSGQSKKELLRLIRQQFPLAEDDQRTANLSSHVIQFLKRANETLKNRYCRPSYSEKEEIEQLLAEIRKIVKK